MFWVISVYITIRNTLPKFYPFLLGHPVYTYVYSTGVNTSRLIYGLESSPFITKSWQYRQLNWKSVTYILNTAVSFNVIACSLVELHSCSKSTVSPSLRITTFSLNLTNLTGPTPQSHYCSCYVTRRILTTPPL